MHENSPSKMLRYIYDVEIIDELSTIKIMYTVASYLQSLPWWW